MTIKSYLFQNRKSVLLLTFLFFTLTSISQTTEIYETYKKKYPGQHLVVLNSWSRVNIDLVKGKPRVSKTYHNEYLLLDKNGILALSEEMVNFSSFEEITINEAYVLVPKGSSSEKIKVTQISTQDADSEGSIFHDDTKEMRLIFPRIEIGALRVFEYTVVISENRFPFGFNFGSYYSNEKTSFEIVCDTAIHPVIRTYNTDKLKIDYTESVKKGVKTMHWEALNTPSFKREDGAPPRNYYMPQVLSQIGYYYYKNERIAVLNDITDLHNWYFTNIKEVFNEKPSEELHAIADSITKNITSEIQKVEAIYYWVQDNIKYIAFEEGINGFVPRQPSSVIIKRYGDCKDMASLIYAMLKSVQIKSYLCWIGSRDLPYKYTDFPSSYCDNHMITLYKNDGNNYFLDATNSFLSYKDVASFTIGKEIFVNIDEQNFEVLELPIPGINYSSMQDTTTIHINGKSISGRGTTYLSGYYNHYLHPAFYETPADKLDEVTNRIINKGNNSCKISNVKVSNLYDRDAALLLNFDYKVDNYTSSLEDEIYVNMILEKDISQGEFKKDRTIPFKFEMKSSDTYTTILFVPEGYSLKYLPSNVSYNSDIVDFSVNYEKVKNSIYMTLKLDIKSILLQPEQFSYWNEYYAKSKSAVSQSLVLIKNK